jgi:hypothetical protein
MTAAADGNPSKNEPVNAAASTPAERALAEAEARRKAAEQAADGRPKEVGRNGPEPTRYGDWEKGGIASDF